MPRRKLDNVRIHVLLTRGQYEKMQKLSERTDYSLSELMRRAIDAYLAAGKKPK